MQLAHRWANRNLTRVELVASLSVLLVLAGLFMRQVEVVFARTERLMVESTLSNLNSALKHWSAFAAMSGNEELLARLVTGNPLRLLQDQEEYITRNASDWIRISGAAAFVPLVSVANYGGETGGLQPGELAPGKWYFDAGENVLIYRIRNERYFGTTLEGPARIRAKVDVRFNDLDGDGRFDPLADQFDSVDLRSLDHFEWLI